MYAGVMNDNIHASPLALENVSHSYGDVAVLRDLNIKVKHGEFVVLVGPSGCGKTTVLAKVATEVRI